MSNSQICFWRVQSISISFVMLSYTYADDLRTELPSFHIDQRTELLINEKWQHGTKKGETKVYATKRTGSISEHICHCCTIIGTGSNVLKKPKGSRHVNRTQYFTKLENKLPYKRITLRQKDHWGNWRIAIAPVPPARLMTTLSILHIEADLIRARGICIAVTCTALGIRCTNIKSALLAFHSYVFSHCLTVLHP